MFDGRPSRAGGTVVTTAATAPLGVPEAGAPQLRRLIMIALDRGRLFYRRCRDLDWN
jgi:hypothetical protein